MMASEVSLDSYDNIFTASPPQPGPGGTKSWDEIRRAVRDTRKLVTALASCVPSSFTFRTIETDNGCVTRLYFLGIPPKNRENTLLYVDVPIEAQDTVPLLPWRILLDSFQPTIPSSQLSREEQLLRERKRLGMFGITSYDSTDKGRKFVFPACNNLFVCEDWNLQSAEPVLPLCINTCCTGARLDPKICPENADLIAFVHNNDVWITSLQSGQERRLSFAHEGGKTLQNDPLSAGVSSFVVQEEFDRFTGYWWQPKQPSALNPNLYHILYEEVDESDVEILHIYAPTADAAGVDEYRYPRAGTCNARSVLKMVEFEVDDNGQIAETVTEKQLYEPLSTFFPWAEYIVRAGWTPDSKYVYAELLDRQQVRLSLILIPIDCFIPVCDDVEMSSFDSSSYPPIQVIYEDTSDIWVNTHDILHFFPQESSNQVKFLWSSEKTGYRHLYLVTSQIQLVYEDVSAMELVDRTDESLTPVIIQEIALTSGDWEVLGKQLWLDEERKIVYFIGLKDSVLENHLYVVSYVSPGEPVRLTELGYSHALTFSSDRLLFVSVYSSIDQTPMSSVHRVCHGSDAQITTQTLGTLMERSACPDYNPPELFSFPSKSGHTIYGMVYRPHNYEQGILYPTVLFVYGGPQVQLATNSFKGLKFLRLHTLASQGYVVVVIDGRGSCHRGLQFESYIKNRLGTVEIEDQVESLQWLASQVDYIDLNRVAIHGWSYGGYLSLMGLAQRPDIFKVAIAGAPVVSWMLYDTGYTERYMDLPINNNEGYQKGAVLTYINSFPDEENRLLIIHGLIDENVHFNHTSELVNGLVRACKPYQLQVYPNERHGIRNHESSEHYKTMVLSFLQRNL